MQVSGFRVKGQSLGLNFEHLGFTIGDPILNPEPAKFWEVLAAQEEYGDGRCP